MLSVDSFVAMGGPKKPQKIVPHYRVCRVMARIPDKKVKVGPPEDVLFVPKPLAHLAAKACSKRDGWMVEHKTLPQDLKEIVEEVGKEGQDWRWFLAKSRSCEEAMKLIKVGSFGRFPQALEKRCPEMFSTDLVATARRVVRFMGKVAELGEMDDVEFISKICVPRYLRFVQLLGKHKEELFIPPLDVSAVWFSHMLQSSEYDKFAEANGIHGIPHHCTLDLPEKERGDAEALGKKLWKETEQKWDVTGKTKVGKLAPNIRACGVDASEELNYGMDFKVSYYSKSPNNVTAGSQEHREALKGKRNLNFPSFNFETHEAVIGDNNNNDEKLAPGFAKMVVGDRAWFAQFTNALQGVDVESDAFLEKSVLGYQKYLYLLTKYPMRMEYIAFGPNPPVDLIWHTHLLQPKSYFKDCKEVMFGVSHHKILPEELRTMIVYEAKLSHEETLWEEEFGESLADYLSV